MRLPLILVLGVLILGSWAATGAVQAEEDAKEAYSYVGVKKCKMCHKKEAKGNQFGIWSESAHAKAYETLAGAKALEAAKELGIENPQTDAKCLKCHVTAFSVMDQLADLKITLEEGVSCESCHGPGSGYKGKKVMAAIGAGETDPATVGLWAVTEETCKNCHIKEGNSFFKEFVFDERVKKIAHPMPEATEGAK